MSGVVLLDCWVGGKPISQGSKTPVRGKGGVMVGMREDNDAELRPWREDVRRVADAERRNADPYPDAVRVDLRFYFARPASRRLAVWHPVKPDADKIARAVLDALKTARVYRDDSQVADLRAVKRYVRLGEPGVQILVSALADDETD